MPHTVVYTERYVAVDSKTVLVAVNVGCALNMSVAS
jgi:hypothetical protein